MNIFLVGGRSMLRPYEILLRKGGISVRFFRVVKISFYFWAVREPPLRNLC